MSKTRTVIGKYVKITHGDHNMSSEGHIISKAAIEVREKGNEKGVSHNNFERKGSDVNDDFMISFSLNKKDNTLVPLGILDYENNYENPFFSFNYSLNLSNLDFLNFEIFNEEGNLIYQMGYLQPIVITAKKKPLVLKEVQSKVPTYDPIKPFKTFDFLSVFQNYQEPDFTRIGSYVIHWDGFNNNDIFDSTIFNGKTLKAKIIAKKGEKEKSLEVEFTTERTEVNWVDVKIDRKNKRIDTTLRVNLKDGGEKGLSCSSTTIQKADYEEASQRLGVENPIKDSTITFCDWDKVPKADLIAGKLLIKSRTRSFADLEKLAIDGLNYHWGRNANHAVAKNVNIVNDKYEVSMNAVNTTENSMDDVSLVYNTNGNWMRSGNPGTATWNPISWVGNAISREAICYNVGYIKGNTWRYREGFNEDIDFKFTSAHEVGHEILKSYGGTVYSYGHKGSVNVVTQSMKKDAPEFTEKGEIDIMPYYPSDPPINQFNRYVAAEKDVLSLIWLTKIEIK